MALKREMVITDRTIGMRTILSLLIAAVFTGTVYFFELRSIRRDYVDASLQFARQTSAQVETLFKHAKESGKENPLDWALQFFSPLEGVKQGNTKLGRLDTVAHHLTLMISEQFHSNFNENTFEYLRLFDSDGRGVRLQTQLGYIGFLGSKNPEMNFLVLGFVFIFIFLLSHTFASDESRIVGEIRVPPPDPKRHESPTGVLRLARCIKKLLKEVQTILNATSKAMEITNSMYFRSSWLKEELIGLKKILANEQPLSPQFKKILSRITTHVDAQYESGLSVQERHQETLKTNAHLHEAIVEIKEALMQEIAATEQRSNFQEKKEASIK
jgi:hypothetical protein